MGMALQMRLRPDGEEELVISMPPAPSDVIYSALQVNYARARTWRLVAYACIALVFVGVVPLTVGISWMAKLETMRGRVPLADRIIRDRPQLAMFWDGMVVSIVLNMLTGFVPTVLVLIFSHTSGVRSEAWCQQRVQQWYFYFQVVFIILV